MLIFIVSLRTLSLFSMTKNCLVIFVVCLIFYSCKESDKRKSNFISANSSKTIQQFPYKANCNDQLLKDYSLFLIKLDTTVFESSTVAAKKYVELFKDQNSNTRDSAFFIFNKFYGILNNSLDDLHRKDTTIKYDSLLTDSNNHLPKLSPKLAAYHQKLKDNGFKIYMSEGDTYIGEDLDFIAKYFYDNVSEPVRDYLIQLNKEDKEGLDEDAGLTISPYKLADRTVWWEKFVQRYPGIIVTDKAKTNWKDYFDTLTGGMDNSPVVDSNDFVNSYYKAVYSHLQKAYPTSKTNILIAPYFKLLLNKQNDKAEALLMKYEKKGY